MRCLVALDKRNLYFAAETAAPLSPSTDPNWMILLIDSDEDGTYDFTIQNSKIINSKGESNSVNVGVGEKCLEMAIPRALVGKTGKQVSFRFKWADNADVELPLKCDGGSYLFTTGDTAPNRRFAYRFVWEK